MGRLACLWLAAVLGIAACGGESKRTVAPESVTSADVSLSLRVARTTGTKHDQFGASITSARTTGVEGQTIRNYTLSAHAERPASACVNNRDSRFPDARAGVRIRAALNPARGEGGPLGWCRGPYRAKVTYFEGYACPAKGRCQPPPGFPTQTRVVARFAFTVK